MCHAGAVCLGCESALHTRNLKEFQTSHMGERSPRTRYNNKRCKVISMIQKLYQIEALKSLHVTIIVVAKI